MRKSSVLLALFASLSVYGWSADKEIIVESFEDGLNVESFRIVDGKWNVSSTKSQAEGVKATKTRYNDADANAGSVRFEPDFPVEGKYEVFITYPSSGNAKDVIHRIVSADGTKEEKLTQNGREFGNVPPANAWHSLGVHTFKAGKSGYVEVADPVTGEKPLAAENGRIYVDAVKFVPQGFELPADYVNKTGGAPAEGAAVTIPAPAPAPTETAPAAAPATDGLPNLPGSTPAATADGLPNLPNETPTSLDSLPTLPDASAPAAPATGTDGLPSLPGSAPAAPAPTADGLPSLPGTPAEAPAAPADGLPSLPGSTPAATADGLPSLPPAGTPVADASALPSLPPATEVTPSPAPSALEGLPSLPPAGTEVAATPVAELPSLPSLVPVTPTPVATLPSVSDTPAIGQGLPTLTPPVMESSTAVPTFGATPAAPVPSSVPTFGTPAAAATGSEVASLQWTYDFGASLAAAKASDKLVFVFFTANGNRAASTYESSYFQDPLVRKALDHFVLVKIDFPQNTRMAYNLSVFGAGIIAITDANGKVVGKIEQIPASPMELIQQMARIRNKALGTVPATPTPAPDAATGDAVSSESLNEETTETL